MVFKNPVLLEFIGDNRYHEWIIAQLETRLASLVFFCLVKACSSSVFTKHGGLDMNGTLILSRC